VPLEGITPRRHGEGSVAREPITDDERQLLTDSRALAKATLQGPFTLQGRTVRGLRIPDLLFDRAVFREVAFEEVTFEGTRFRAARLEDVSFGFCELRRPVLEGCQLLRVSVEEGTIREPRLERCQVAALSTMAAQVLGGSIEACELDGWKDDHLTMKGTRLARSRITNPAWSVTRLSQCQLEDLEIHGGKLTRVAVSSSPVRRLTVRGAEVEGLEILFGALEGLELDGLRGGSVALADLELDGVRLHGSRLAGLTLSSVRGRGLSIEACPWVQLLMLLAAELEGLRVADSTLDGPTLRGSQVHGAAVVERCQLLGLDLEGSAFEDLTLREVLLDGPLSAAGARFGRLALDQVRQGPEYRLDDAGAVYPAASRLPAP